MTLLRTPATRTLPLVQQKSCSLRRSGGARVAEPSCIGRAGSQRGAFTSEPAEAGARPGQPLWHGQPHAAEVGVRSGQVAATCPTRRSSPRPDPDSVNHASCSHANRSGRSLGTMGRLNRLPSARGAGKQRNRSRQLRLRPCTHHHKPERMDPTRRSGSRCPQQYTDSQESRAPGLMSGRFHLWRRSGQVQWGQTSLASRLSAVCRRNARRSVLGTRCSSNGFSEQSVPICTRSTTTSGRTKLSTTG